MKLTTIVNDNDTVVIKKLNSSPQIKTQDFLIKYSALKTSILANVGAGFSGSYNDLTDKPTLFDGDYNTLANKPTIPTDTGSLTDITGRFQIDLANFNFIKDLHDDFNTAVFSQPAVGSDQFPILNAGLNWRLNQVDLSSADTVLATSDEYFKHPGIFRFRPSVISATALMEALTVNFSSPQITTILDATFIFKTGSNFLNSAVDVGLKSFGPSPGSSFGTGIYLRSAIGSNDIIITYVKEGVAVSGPTVIYTATANEWIIFKIAFFGNSFEATVNNSSISYPWDTSSLTLSTTTSVYPFFSMQNLTQDDSLLIDFVNVDYKTNLSLRT